MQTWRFWNKVDKSHSCWLWTGKTRSGYGRFMVDGHYRSAHRVAYELLIGPIPDGAQLDHLCRNRACVNPGHLEPATARTNILRGTGLAATESRQVYCVNGHHLYGDNVIVIPSRPNARYCRECNRARGRAYQQRRRDERRRQKAGS
jgi:HNH endonuclease